MEKEMNDGLDASRFLQDLVAWNEQLDHKNIPKEKQAREKYLNEDWERFQRSGRVVADPS